jgi:hypothetical protein
MFTTKTLWRVALVAAVLSPGLAQADGCEASNCPMAHYCGTDLCLGDCCCGYTACPCGTICAGSPFLPCEGQSNPCLCWPCQRDPDLCRTCREASAQCTGSSCPPGQGCQGLRIWFPCPVIPFDPVPDWFGRNLWLMVKG